MEILTKTEIFVKFWSKSWFFEYSHQNENFRKSRLKSRFLKILIKIFFFFSKILTKIEIFENLD